jgi:hypothetical protein
MAKLTADHAKRLHPDNFAPELRMFGDEFAHHPNAFFILEPSLNPALASPSAT